MQDSAVAAAYRDNGFVQLVRASSRQIVTFGPSVYRERLVQDMACCCIQRRQLCVMQYDGSVNPRNHLLFVQLAFLDMCGLCPPPHGPRAVAAQLWHNRGCLGFIWIRI